MSMDHMSNQVANNDWWYFNYRRRKRKLERRKERSPFDHHLGPLWEYIGRLNAEARRFGSVRPIEHWGVQEYSVKMFDSIADERTLYYALESLKGEAPGDDGVRPGDIRRYAVYKAWCAACGYHGKKAPPYRSTVFPLLTDGELFIISLLCDPHPKFEAKCVDFEARRWSRTDLPSNSDLRQKYKHYRRELDIAGFRNGSALSRPPDDDEIDSARRKLFFELRQLPGNYLLDHDDAECNLLLDRAKQCGMAPGIIDTPLLISYDKAALAEALPRAGADRKRIADLAGILTKAVAREIEQWHSHNAKSFVLFIPNMELAVRYREYPRELLDWYAMRRIRDLLGQIPKNGKGFRPGKMRKVPIPKADGGTRDLSLPTATERIAAKATLVVLQPVMEKVFLPSNVGCRFDKDRFDALATIAVNYPVSPGKIILLADIKKAFDNVPHDRVMEVVEAYVPNGHARTLLERIIRRPGFEDSIGLAQGDPLSPLFLNMLLHVHLDVPIDGFMRENGLVYFRYVDDISVFGLTSHKQGKEVLQLIGEHLDHVGLSLHTEPPKTQIVDLAHASAESHVETTERGDFEVDRYLGIGLRGGSDGELEFFLPSSWEERIRDMYTRAERKIKLGGYENTPGADKHILHASESWIRAFAPALQYEDKDMITARIVQICQGASRHPMDGPEELYDVWDRAQGWWKRKCSEV